MSNFRKEQNFSVTQETFMTCETITIFFCLFITYLFLPPPPFLTPPPPVVVEERRL